MCSFLPTLCCSAFVLPKEQMRLVQRKQQVILLILPSDFLLYKVNYYKTKLPFYHYYVKLLSEFLVMEMKTIIIKICNKHLISFLSIFDIDMPIYLIVRSKQVHRHALP